MIKPFYEDSQITEYQGHILDVLRERPTESVHCIVTSPPYWGLRDYGLEPQMWDDPGGCEHVWGETIIEKPKHTDNGIQGSTLEGSKSTQAQSQRSESSSQFCQKCNAWRGSLGLEPTPELYIQHIVQVFREIWRVGRPDCTVWLNIGDSYVASGGHTKSGEKAIISGKHADARNIKSKPVPFNLKIKDLCMIPARVALALQADGWWLRSDIIWAKCLSGGSIVYAKTQKGEMPMTIREMSRLKPETVKLWSGKSWTQIREIEEVYPSESIEIRFRNGQSVGCTLEHKWPVLEKGKIQARHLRIGDVIESCILPEPKNSEEPKSFPDWLGEIIGCYLAEGSRSGKTIQFSLHKKEAEIVKLLQNFADWFGGSLHVHIYGNSCHANVEGNLCVAAIETYIAGKDAKRKHLRVVAWRRSNLFLKYLLKGYLEGDGGKQDETFWKLGFAANEALARDLRTICARLSLSIRLKWTWAFETKTMKKHKAMRGEMKDPRRRITEDWEIIKIQPSKGRRFYHIGIDDPHKFALSSGILTCNSNPMPESVTDRPTNSHEHVFLLAKSQKYFYDADAVREPHKPNSLKRYEYGHNAPDDPTGMVSAASKTGAFQSKRMGDHVNPAGRNLRSVWTIATEPTPEAHFATFPSKLCEIAIKAGTSERGCCPECGGPWVRVMEKSIRPDGNRPYGVHYESERGDSKKLDKQLTESKTIGWKPSCNCVVYDRSYPIPFIPCTVLDPFSGSGRALIVAKKLGRKAIGIDLKAEYLEMPLKKLAQERLI